jgi:hypothetical protein
VTVDAYRDASNAAGYREQVRAMTEHGKPAAIGEFGCCTYRGASDRGAHGWMILAGAGADRRVNGSFQRDEYEQARHLRELFELYGEEGIDTAFWYTFASYDKPRREDPQRDLDLASYGVIAVPEAGGAIPRRAWIRKPAFAALCAVLSSHDARPADARPANIGERLRADCLPRR